MAKLESAAVLAVVGLIGFVLWKVGSIKMPDMAGLLNIPSWQENYAGQKDAAMNRLYDWKVSDTILDEMRKKGVTGQDAYTEGGGLALDRFVYSDGTEVLNKVAIIPNPGVGGGLGITRFVENQGVLAPQSIRAENWNRAGNTQGGGYAPVSLESLSLSQLQSLGSPGTSSSKGSIPTNQFQSGIGLIKTYSTGEKLYGGYQLK